ncbi:hypothetical protein RI444_05285 [Paenarthrobacter sp. AT5]|uniref:hypothetical protein n=1 Tax=Paenarthrobacter TaxID=1742992 RepID=UPI001A98E45B|nr:MULTISPECIES: hypothetical protein [Paenarthrobacter]WOC62056.1 hypothetical protein RI444_05285 [Paenarthrobacter sp. AT5]
MTLMDEGIYLYPRLDSAAALRELDDQASQALSVLRMRTDTSHIHAAASATGGIPVPSALLEDLQTILREVADEFKFPKPLNLERQQEFDRICGTVLHNKMRVVPGDAAEEGIWSFVSLVLVPEIAPWRFPSRHPDRILGKPRNTFRRLWWRAWSLGPDLTVVPTGSLPLNEDDYFQIMERTSISGDKRTARELQARIWKYNPTLTGVEKGATRNDLLRELIKRIRAQKSHIAFHALDDDQLSLLIDDCLSSSAAILGVDLALNSVDVLPNSSVTV